MTKTLNQLNPSTGIADDDLLPQGDTSAGEDVKLEFGDLRAYCATDISDRVVYVADYTALKNHDGQELVVVEAKENGGRFQWLVGDYSSEVADDTGELVYVESNITPATSGVWKRLELDVVGYSDFAGEVDGLRVLMPHNPDGQAGWTDQQVNNYEGLSVNLGGLGNRTFGGFGIPTAIAGSVNVPSTATLNAHSTGIAGYADTASTTTGGVAIFGESNVRASNSLSWGLNTVTQDQGFETTVWGYECDLNITNANTTVLGVQVVGGSTVTPNLSIGFQVAPIGTFASPVKAWSIGFDTKDGAATLGLSIGALNESANSPSQPIKLFYRDGTNTRHEAMELIADGGGNATIYGAATGSFFGIRSYGSSQNVITIQGDNLAFHGNGPVARQTVTGSRGGNAALADLLTKLDNLGLIVNSTS